MCWQAVKELLSCFLQLQSAHFYLYTINFIHFVHNTECHITDTHLRTACKPVWCHTVRQPAVHMALVHHSAAGGAGKIVVVDWLVRWHQMLYQQHCMPCPYLFTTQHYYISSLLTGIDSTNSFCYQYSSELHTIIHQSTLHNNIYQIRIRCVH